MTQGILLFAHNNEHFNYGLMAVWQSKRLTKFLGKPVSLVTDRATVQSLRKLGIKAQDHFDQIFFSDAETKQSRSLGHQWVLLKNVDRVNAYDLTPYDETLVIDTDIIIQSDRLNLVWGHQEDILVSKYAVDVFNRNLDEFDRLKDQGVDFYWATEFWFRKSETAKVFFDLAKCIKENYKWFALLYGVGGKLLRNDHVWSIALHELGKEQGASWADRIPRTLMYSLDGDKIVKFTDTSVVLLGKEKDQPKVANIADQDLHFMNKFELMPMIEQELGITK